MKFLMLMIICFAEDACQAVFDYTKFDSYEQCMAQAMPISQYMKDTYTTSAGEIHCLSEDDWAEYKLFIDNGGIPVLSFDPDQISDA